MNQKKIDTIVNALRSQGLNWSQTNFAVALIRNAESSERERCADICDGVALVCADTSDGARKTASMNAAQSCARLIRG